MFYHINFYRKVYHCNLNPWQLSKLNQISVFMWCQLKRQNCKMPLGIFQMNWNLFVTTECSQQSGNKLNIRQTQQQLIMSSNSHKNNEFCHTYWKLSSFGNVICSLQYLHHSHILRQHESWQRKRLKKMHYQRGSVFTRHFILTNNTNLNNEHSVETRVKHCELWQTDI